VKEVVPNAKLVYNNSPSFNWTLNFRNQVYEEMIVEGENMTAYDRNNLMDEKYDISELGYRSDQRIKTFQVDGAREAGIFHHLITLPTYHTTALQMNNLTEGYFGEDGMLAYVKGVQRQEIRKGVACVKHQRMAGSDLGDAHKTFFAGDKALKAGGTNNTSNQFDVSETPKKIRNKIGKVA
jgi:isocitrate lyase